MHVLQVFPSLSATWCRRLCLLAAAGVLGGLTACGGGDDALAQAAPAVDAAAAAPVAMTGEEPAPPDAQALAATTATTVALKNPILFVTQVPTSSDMATRVGTFANHLTRVRVAPRGGDLMIRYPDGMLRNLTKEAGLGMEGLQGANAIAVREPSVHWSGTKALFSMVVGAPARQYVETPTWWQIYEVSGLGKGQAVRISRVAGQPAGYNNVSPFYGTDERVLFTSDRPRGGEAHLYPQLDEYESTPTNTGLWALDRTTQKVELLNHAVSGVFSPSIDSVGRVVFTRWDHLQRDQQADGGKFGAFNVASEASDAPKLAAPVEHFPEPRAASASPYGSVNGHTFNLFSPWEMNEDGTAEETLNHIGRHEMQLGAFARSFATDTALLDYVSAGFTTNRKTIRGDGGIFQMREDPRRPGMFFGIYGREFGELGANQIVRFQGGAGMNPELMFFADVTDPALADGRYRNPLPLADGQMIAAHTASTSLSTPMTVRFRMRRLDLQGTTGRFGAGPLLTGTGIVKTVSWWDPDVKMSYSGPLWELEPVEVVARLKPARRAAPPLAAPEKAILTEENVDEAALRAWLKANNLALIVTRDQTSRDRADRQQPYNLQVPGGVRAVTGAGRTYDIAHYQIFQADSVRGYTVRAGRRPIAQPMHDDGGRNLLNPSGPTGSVQIAADGSTAAFVPARRALTWQVTDPTGTPVVRERVWVTFQPGEVRVCASCHGVNQADQIGRPAPTHKPEALRALLRHWNTLPK